MGRGVTEEGPRILYPTLLTNLHVKIRAGLTECHVGHRSTGGGDRRPWPVLVPAGRTEG